MQSPKAKFNLYFFIRDLFLRDDPDLIGFSVILMYQRLQSRSHLNLMQHRLHRRHLIL